MRADLDDIDGWFKRIVKQLIGLLAAAWRAVRDLTGMYLQDHAAAEGRTVEPTFAQWNTEQVATSMRVTGPVAFKKAIADGQTPTQARASMVTQMVGAAEKSVLRADRDTVMATVESSDEIVGWRRVSDGDPCAWCAMLISRGAVYETKTSATRVVGRRGVARGGQELGASYHDHDRCSAEPLYEHEDEPPEVAALYQLWVKVTAGKSGAEALRVWRADWDALHRDIAAQRDRAGETAPRPEPQREPEVDERQQRARERQAAIDTARSRAEMLAELEEIAVINQADGDELARMARVAADRFGVTDDPELAKLLQRAASGDPAMVEATLEAVAARLGLNRIGGDLGADQLVKFDRSRHDMLPGEKPTPVVEIVRPGYVAMVDGEELIVVRAKVAASDRKLAPAVASRFYRSLDGLEDLADFARAGDQAERRKLYGGQSAKVELVTLPDGRVAVSKRAEDWGDKSPEVAEDLRRQADAEQMAFLFGRAIDAPVARVYRDKPDHIWVEFIEGSPDDVGAAMIGSLQGIRLGLLDMLSAGVDRNGGNMIGRHGELIGIDHGFNWGQHIIGDDLMVRPVPEEPAHHFADESGLLDSNPLAPEDVDVIRGRLEALRPDFAHIGREDWLDYSLRMLERLRPHAKGKRRLYG